MWTCQSDHINLIYRQHQRQRQTIQETNGSGDYEIFILFHLKRHVTFFSYLQFTFVTFTIISFHLKSHTL